MASDDPLNLTLPQRALVVGLTVASFGGLGAYAGGGETAVTVMCLFMGGMVGFGLAVFMGPDEVSVHGATTLHSRRHPGPPVTIRCQGCQAEGPADTVTLRERLRLFALIPLWGKTTVIVSCVCGARYTSTIKPEQLAGYPVEQATQSLKPWTPIA